VGKVVQPLQSVNCHDSRADGHERHGPFTRLVGVLLIWVWSSTGFVWFGYGGETCKLCSVLATEVRPVSFVRFWLQG
jgi:hypothetical protein